jgi:hypothetical protein
MSPSPGDIQQMTALIPPKLKQAMAPLSQTYFSS